LVASGKVADAIKIYLFMADGDQSLDAGYLGERLGECYEKIGDLHAAKYWYGRAVEENPDVRLISLAAHKRLHEVSIDVFLGDAEKYFLPSTSIYFVNRTQILFRHQRVTTELAADRIHHARLALDRQPLLFDLSV
jgi:tetratricopeptide (TPR) repeat protein